MILRIIFRTITCALAIAPVSVQAQNFFSIQVVVDNDFALYAVDTSGGLRELYQNGANWPDQLTSALLVNFSLLPDEDRIMIWARDIGGEENISGKINGINMVDAVRLNSLAVLAGQITNLTTTVNSGGTPDFSANQGPSLADVQAAFNGATFGPALERFGGSGETVIANNLAALTTVGLIGRYGFEYANNGNNPNVSSSVVEQSLFLFEGADFGILPIPEPSSFLALLVSVGAFTLRRRRVNS